MRELESTSSFLASTWNYFETLCTVKYRGRRGERGSLNYVRNLFFFCLLNSHLSYLVLRKNRTFYYRQSQLYNLSTPTPNGSSDTWPGFPSPSQVSLFCKHLPVGAHIFDLYQYSIPWIWIFHLRYKRISMEVKSVSLVPSFGSAWPLIENKAHKMLKRKKKQKIFSLNGNNC